MQRDFFAFLKRTKFHKYFFRLFVFLFDERAFFKKLPSSFLHKKVSEKAHKNNKMPRKTYTAALCYLCLNMHLERNYSIFGIISKAMMCILFILLVMCYSTLKVGKNQGPMRSRGVRWYHFTSPRLQRWAISMVHIYTFYDGLSHIRYVLSMLQSSLYGLRRTFSTLQQNACV